MITIFRGSKSHVVVPTIFPDQTSQVWKLPEWALSESGKQVHVTWNFENEREIIDLLSLERLCDFTVLNIPYLPYARQDKGATNNSTFNLSVFADLTDLLDVDIKTFDVHSSEAEYLIVDLKNTSPKSFHKKVIEKVNPNYIVFPDLGAFNRYPNLRHLPNIIFEKTRNQKTGEITGHKMVKSQKIKSGDSFLIVDDLCDGGATFISVSNALHAIQENIRVDLCVSHGIFSKGVDVLHKAGINEIWTTNSLKQKFNVNIIEV